MISFAYCTWVASAHHSQPRTPAMRTLRAASSFWRSVPTHAPGPPDQIARLPHQASRASPSRLRGQPAHPLPEKDNLAVLLDPLGLAAQVGINRRTNSIPPLFGLHVAHPSIPELASSAASWRCALRSPWENAYWKSRLRPWVWRSLVRPPPWCRHDCSAICHHADAAQFLA